MDYLMGPPFLDADRLEQRRAGGKLWENPIQPDPVVAIIDFYRQLSQRGIQLILMPTPIKASIQPELFSSGAYRLPLQNRSWSEFVVAMEEAGILLFDPATFLVTYQRNKATSAYLQTDTHWTAHAMEYVAEQLSNYIQAKILLSTDTIFLSKNRQPRKSVDE